MQNPQNPQNPGDTPNVNAPAPGMNSYPYSYYYPQQGMPPQQNPGYYYPQPQGMPPQPGYYPPPNPAQPGMQPQYPSFPQQYPPNVSVPPTYGDNYQQFQQPGMMYPSYPPMPSMPSMPGPAVVQPSQLKKKRIIIGVPSDLYFNGFQCQICKKNFELGKTFWHSENGENICEKCHFRSPNDESMQHFSGLAKPLPSEIKHFKKESVDCKRCGTKDLVFFFKEDAAPYWLCQQCYEQYPPSENNFSFIDKKQSTNEGSSSADDTAQKITEVATQFINNLLEPFVQPMPKPQPYPMPIINPPMWPVQSVVQPFPPVIKEFAGSLPKQSYDTGFRCDKCGKNYPAATPFYHNHSPALNNNYDLCRACYKNLNLYFEHAKYINDFRLYTGEPKKSLPDVYKSMSSNVIVSCDGCGTSGLLEFFHKKPQGGVDPQLDLCKNCFCTTKYGADDFSFHRIKKENREEIVKGVPAPGYCGGFACNLCGKQYESGVPFYHCPICSGFDICQKCHETKSHPHESILYTSRPIDWSSNQINCDGCGKKGLKKFFHKKNTNYDLCKKCFAKRSYNDRVSEFVYGKIPGAHFPIPFPGVFPVNLENAPQEL